jgi:hypothetical protein
MTSLIEQSCKRCGLGRRADGTPVPAIPGVICAGHEFQIHQEAQPAAGKTSIICSHSSIFALILSFPVYYHLGFSHVVNLLLIFFFSEHSQDVILKTLEVSKLTGKENLSTVI